MAKNEEKTCTKLIQKKKNKQLTKEEKNSICVLLASHSLGETAELISRKTKKDISRSRVQYYMESEKWIPKIIEARGKDIEKAMLVPITGLAFRSRQYQALFDGAKERYQLYKENIKGFDIERFLPIRFKLLREFIKDEEKVLLEILDSAKRDMREARILQGPAEEETELDFDEIVESITISRKRRKGQRDLAKKAGLAHD